MYNMLCKFAMKHTEKWVMLCYIRWNVWCNIQCNMQWDMRCNIDSNWPYKCVVLCRVLCFILCSMCVTFAACLLSTFPFHPTHWFMIGHICNVSKNMGFGSSWLVFSLLCLALTASKLLSLPPNYWQLGQELLRFDAVKLR